MTNVVLDTNALMMPFQFKVDVVGELQRLLGGVEIFVPETCIIELQHLSDRKAAAALKFAQRFEIRESVGGGDDAVLALAGQLHAVIVTNDATLRKRARSAGLKVAFLRGKDHLALE